MRIVKNDSLSKYTDIKKALYFDTRCVISKTEEGLICIFREPNGIASKRQREWMYSIFDRVAKRELADFELSESKEGHFYLLATKNEKISTKQNRKKREDKHTGKQEPAKAVS